MAMIAMAVYDTEENKRSEITDDCLDSLIGTTDIEKHRIFLIDNNSCDRTKRILEGYTRYENVELITLPENVGTARAINRAWKLRQPGEHCIKMDNDIIINSPGWVDEMEEAIRRMPIIGQIGLKRKDCWEHPAHESDDFRSELLDVPHTPGERWITVEKCRHIIGSVVMHSAALVEKCGGLFQYGLYGYDDVIYSHKSRIAGFINVFLRHISIDHIDPGDTPYQDWKQKHSGEQTQKVIDLVHAMIDGKESIYHPFT